IFSTNCFRFLIQEMLTQTGRTEPPAPPPDTVQYSPDSKSRIALGEDTLVDLLHPPEKKKCSC
ncbi:hypothetical protein BaRGS_00034949, partial [Batillaria attramentaria]